MPDISMKKIVPELYSYSQKRKIQRYNQNLNEHFFFQIECVLTSLQCTKLEIHTQSQFTLNLFIL